jgi:hypothetical protein
MDISDKVFLRDSQEVEFNTNKKNFFKARPDILEGN